MMGRNFGRWAHVFGLGDLIPETDVEDRFHSRGTRINEDESRTTDRDQTDTDTSQPSPTDSPSDYAGNWPVDYPDDFRD